MQTIPPRFSGWHGGEPLADIDGRDRTNGLAGKVKGEEGNRSLSGELDASEMWDGERL
jgi:hypothetical protein